MPVSIATFYQFCAFPDFEKWREPLRKRCEAGGILGTVLLADEGLNATVAGPQAELDALLAWLRADGRFSVMEVRWSRAEANPFHRMKVRLKREIVHLGAPEADPRREKGRYVPPSAWNALMADAEVKLVDTRNVYETRVGSFRGAIDPRTEAFDEFPGWAARNLDPDRDRRIALFCTGGIRCEKAAALLSQRGFREVYQLRGGILHYLEEIPARESTWEGACFVFDERVALGVGLLPSGHRLCRNCREPLGPEEYSHPSYEEGVACPHCRETLTDERMASLRERQRQVELAELRGEGHIGRKME